MRGPSKLFGKVLGSSKEGRIRIIGIFLRMMMIGRLAPTSAKEVLYKLGNFELDSPAHSRQDY